MDDMSLRGLCQLGLRAACSSVHKLTLPCDEDITADLIKTACSSSHLTELQVKRNAMQGGKPSLTKYDAESFCVAVASSCPQLAKLSITDIILDNGVAAEILRRMRKHESLKHIT